MVDQAMIRARLVYNPDTGQFFWRESGKLAGTFQSAGYRAIRIDRIRYLASRLAWLYMTGEWPKVLIDHKDGDQANDRWDNLRAATYSQNNANSDRPHKGITYRIKRKKWEAFVTINGRQTYLGGFVSAEEAKDAYKEAALKHFGEFAKFD